MSFVFLQAFLNKHCGELVSVCEAHLTNIILSENGTKDLNEELMVRARLSVDRPSYCIFFSTQVKMSAFSPCIIYYLYCVLRCLFVCVVTYAMQNKLNIIRPISIWTAA